MVLYEITRIDQPSLWTTSKTEGSKLLTATLRDMFAAKQNVDRLDEVQLRMVNIPGSASKTMLVESLNGNFEGAEIEVIKRGNEGQYQRSWENARNAVAA